ncbi:hypothetical protein [Thermosediminibacter litoriperuensis]|uniref:PrsW family intramembrane metalloprotease n=1 Tax=Thermosediminibacter litoriperuensis TaxID=291989 RepID=A0A5S5AJ00_9FIRM|nr:hypothetical protein [Thermosediminibacter litoriperuensis]TYP50863.1 hypothetical protein LZ11_01982 [Thermosediminibacter litoriperuensis]
MDQSAGYGVAAGLLSALFSLVLNTKLARVVKEEAITLGAPVFEEIFKTGIAALLGGDILSSHVTFGVVEAFYDAARSRGGRSYLAGALALLSHAFFGAAAVLVVDRSGSLAAGIFISALLHMSWNRWVMGDRVQPKK